MGSIFVPLEAEGFTTLRVRHDFRTGVFSFYAARDFEQGLDFSRYNKDFGQYSILTTDNRYLGTDDVVKMYEQHGLEGYLNEVLDLIRQGKHVGVDFMSHERLGIRFICGIHSDVRGRNNKSYTTFAGATRRHGRDVPEMNVIVDALNLSRAMSFKNIATNLPYGGCKTCLHMDELSVTDMESMGFLAYACDTTHCITGPDMNLPKVMVKVMNEHFTRQYCGGPGSAMGDTAVPTALGAFLALKEAVKFVTGSADLGGMSVAVQGMGAVGYSMAKNLAAEGARLIITDPDQTKTRRFADEHPGVDVTIVATDEILFVDADVLAPCAMGGVLGEEEIAKLKVKYVFGAANNQLRATNQEEEIRLAKLVAARGILFQTEWWHNGAGVLGAAMEYIHGRDITLTPADLESKVREIIPVNTRDNLQRAADLGITPTESAYARCQDIIYG